MGHGETFKSAASKVMRAATVDFRFFRIPSESEAQAWLEFDVDRVELATAELESRDCRMLVKARRNPGGQIVSRFLSPEGL